MVNWYVGPEDYVEFLLAKVFSVPGTSVRMVPTAANGEPAVVLYMGRGGDVLRLHTLQVFTVGLNGISRMVAFQDTEIFESFELAATLPG